MNTIAKTGFALLAVIAAATACRPARAAPSVTLCDFTPYGAAYCITAPVVPLAPDAKVIQVEPTTDETEEAWAARCAAVLVRGKRPNPDRWHIGNPHCR